VEGNYFKNKISVIIATALRKFDPSAVVVKAVDGSVFLPFYCRVEFTTPDKFFTELEGEASKLCCWSGELYLELHNGTYTTQAKVRRFSTRLLSAFFVFSALTLLIGHQEEHPTCKNIE